MASASRISPRSSAAWESLRNAWMRSTMLFLLLIEALTPACVKPAGNLLFARVRRILQAFLLCCLKALLDGRSRRFDYHRRRRRLGARPPVWAGSRGRLIRNGCDCCAPARRRLRVWPPAAPPQSSGLKVCGGGSCTCVCGMESGSGGGAGAPAQAPAEARREPRPLSSACRAPRNPQARLPVRLPELLARVSWGSLRRQSAGGSKRSCLSPVRS